MKAATINPAKAAKLDKDFGSITVGKMADLLVVPSFQYDLEEIYLGGQLQ